MMAKEIKNGYAVVWQDNEQVPPYILSRHERLGAARAAYARRNRRNQPGSLVQVGSFDTVRVLSDGELGKRVPPWPGNGYVGYDGEELT